jgi:hypothetical protein
MRELLVTNDLVLLGYVETLLAGSGIECVIFDRHISLMEGSIGAFPRRLLVKDEAWGLAARIMDDAGLTVWVKDDGGA